MTPEAVRYGFFPKYSQLIMKSSYKVKVTFSEQEYETLRTLLYVVKQTNYYRNLEEMSEYETLPGEIDPEITINLVESICGLMPETITSKEIEGMILETLMSN